MQFQLGSLRPVRTTWTFHVVSINFDVVRNRLYGYQCYCSHMTTEKSCNKHIVVEVRTDPYPWKILDPPLRHGCLIGAFWLPGLENPVLTGMF